MPDVRRLHEHLLNLGRIVLGYSGGVDSALLAVVVTRALGPAQFLAVIGRSASNPVDRCYFCKAELWTRLQAVAREEGFAVVIDGTNADDLGEHRPGTPWGLSQVERAEALVGALGVTGDLRVRHVGDTARIEVRPEEFSLVDGWWKEINLGFRELGFSAVERDPRGYRRGALLALQPVRP